MSMDPVELKEKIGAGLLSFPVTHFDQYLEFDESPYRNHVDWLIEHGPAGLFAAGGTGEFFSLSQDEFPAIIAAAVAAAEGRVPVIAGCGYGTRMAIQYAGQAQAAGADGILLLPHYLIRSEQEGLFRHAKAVCDSVALGVVIYNRDNSIMLPETLERLAGECPNFIGYKDGHGDLELVVRICNTLGERVTYIGGMPTAEIYAAGYKAAGIGTYSSAVFNFLPRLAHDFFDGLVVGDEDKIARLLRDFYLPFIALRDRRRGYAVSIIKAGMRIVGRDAGPIRPPLTDLSDEEVMLFEQLIKRYSAPVSATIVLAQHES